jgi:hypothetical protein
MGNINVPDWLDNEPDKSKIIFIGIISIVLLLIIFYFCGLHILKNLFIEIFGDEKSFD